jgi:dihydrodipicolinate synthase/N-acetylneuraminate lyase
MTPAATPHPVARTMPDPGPFPVLPAVFDSSGGLVLPAMARQIDFCELCGVEWVCVPAFGSEFYKLDPKERSALIAEVLRLAEGRVKVAVQCNHVHAPTAAALAKQAEADGASMISTAIPRGMPASEESVARYAVTVAGGTTRPVILQDWNPAGPSLSAEALCKIAAQCTNLAFIKLEEPSVAQRACILRDAAGVRILTGWGGMYLLEQLPAGIAGVMPGLPLLDVFAAIWKSWQAGDQARVFRLQALVFPYIQFSLRNLEQFLHCEKILAVRRGLLPSAVVRDPTVALFPSEVSSLDFIITEMMAQLADEGFAAAPLGHL